MDKLPVNNTVNEWPKDKYGYDRVFELHPTEEGFELRQIVDVNKRHIRFLAEFDWPDEQYAKICLKALNDRGNYDNPR